MRAKDEIIKLRAHHILCIQGFQGYGYDGQFVAHLKKLISEITSHHIKKVELVWETDYICSLCPHHVKKHCVKRKNGKRIKIEKIDLKVLKIMSIKRNIQSPEQLFKLSFDKFRKPTQLNNICNDCEWQKVCLWYKKIFEKFNICHLA